MELMSFLEQNREAVLAKWFESIVKTYPKQTAQFLTNQRDRFRNPVGYAIDSAIGPLFDQVISTMNAEELSSALDGIVRIRSVQDFTPSQAIAFVFQLKSLVREVLAEKASMAEFEGSNGESDQLADLDSRIDRVAMIAFDKYMECREKLFEIRTNEIRNQSGRLLERINLRSDASKHKGEPVDDAI